MDKSLKSYVVDDRDTGIFRVHRNLFTDEEIFALEMRRIFESTWIFLGVESQLSKPHDYVSTYIGRQPVFLTRDAGGKLNCFFNTCRHRGAVLVHQKCGNAARHVCRYHSWSYDSAGRNVHIKDLEHGAYPPTFAQEDHDLVPIPRLDVYKGIIFGSLNADVVPLGEYLGDFRWFLDLLLEHGEQGMEIVPGGATYTFDANWKLQIENGMDYYHLTSAHTSFMNIVSRRNVGESSNRQVRSPDFSTRRSVSGGMYTFRHGHSVIWNENPSPEDRPLWQTIDKVRERVGPLKAKWMLSSRNMTLFPSLQLTDATSTILRVIRPLSVNQTEMRLHCFAPIGEPSEARERRIRQFEDFFNPSGLATPDDNACYADCQQGYAATSPEWLQGYARGGAQVFHGADELARQLGFSPVTSLHGPFPIQNETVFHAGYREWLRLMVDG